MTIFKNQAGFRPVVVYVQRLREGLKALREALLPLHDRLIPLREALCALREQLIPLHNQLQALREALTVLRERLIVLRLRFSPFVPFSNFAQCLSYSLSRVGKVAIDKFCPKEPI